MKLKQKIILILSVLVTVAFAVIILIILPKEDNPESVIDTNFFPIQLGPGYSVAVRAVVAKCGPKLQLIEYRLAGYQLEGGGKAEYTFTRGKCHGNKLTSAHVFTDINRNSVIGEVEIRSLGGDDREPMSDSDLKSIKITLGQAERISGLPIVSLFKRGGFVVWRAVSISGPMMHDIWVNASTGNIVRNESVIPTM